MSLRRLSVALVSLLAPILLSACGLPGSSSPTGAAGAILGWTPGVQREVPLTAPFSVFFSRPMDHASVERSWAMRPTVPGTFRWQDASLTFQPRHALSAGAYYHLTVGPGAKDDQGKTLPNPLSVGFSTGDHLHIQSFTPASGTTEVPINGIIAISFNHPMVALAGLDAGTPNPSGWHVSISPRTPGHGSWIGTSTWVFHADGGLLPSSRYTVQLSGRASDAWGEQLGSNLAWSFKSATPQIISEQPGNGAQLADPSGSVRATFNQAMDRSATAAAFSLRTSAGAVVSGTIEWQGNTLLFRPASPLDPTQTYRARIGKKAPSLNGNASLGGAVSWSFHVARPPEVVSTDPAGGSSAAQPTVDFKFSAPVDQSSLDHHLTVDPPLANLSTNRYGDKNTIYGIVGDFQPSTVYTITIGSGAVDQYGREVKPYSLRFTTAPLDPTVALYGQPGGAGSISFSAGHVVNAPVQLVNVPTVQYSLLRVAPAALSSGFSYGGPLSFPAGTTIRQWTDSIPGHLNHVQNMGVPLAQTNGSPLAAGLYWLGAQGVVPGRTQKNSPSYSELVLAANTNITMEAGANGTLVWVLSARTGKPLAGIRVRLLGENGKTLADSVTDSSGVSQFTIGTGGSTLAAMVDDGTHFGLAVNGWQPPLSGSNVPGEQYVPPPTGTFAYTDRPVYRLGQTVHFRAMLWNSRDGVYSLLGPRTVSASATDCCGHTLYQSTLGLDRFGVVHGKFRIPANGATGYGNVVVTLKRPGGQDISAGTQFVVAQYRKPELLATVTTDHPSYAQGQTVHAVASVKYAFGAPATGQQIGWVAYSQNRYGAPPGFESYTFGNSDALTQQLGQPGLGVGPFGKVIAQGTGTTDASGKLAISLPVNVKNDLVAQTITIEATTTDVNHQSVSARAQVAANQAVLSVGLMPRAQVVPVGQTEAVDVVVLGSSASPAGGQTLTAHVYKRTLTSRLAPALSGIAYWESVPHDTLVDTQSLTTNSSGRATVSFTPKTGGAYFVKVEATDTLSNSAASSTSIEASAAGFTDFGTTADTSLPIKLDKPTYRVGDIAKVLVSSPFDHATALITVERNNVHYHRVLQLASNAAPISLKVTADDLPNAFISVTVYRGWRDGSAPDWRSGTATLHVRLDPKKVIIHLRQDRTHYHPGDRVTYTVSTTDVRGKPVTAQVSLALVDTTLLSLVTDPNPDILQALYGDYSVGVFTSSDGAISIDHLQQQPNFQLRPGGLGGGGGGGPGEAPSLAPPPKGVHVRKQFKDTAYWNPSITTIGGIARIQVRLPDNLTTWRLQARAITNDMRVGQATLNTVSTQDLIVRPAAPRFLLQGDTVQLGAVVNNNLGQQVDAKVTLQAAGVSLGSDPSVSVSVPPHGERLVTWTVTVPATTRAQLRFTAEGSNGVQGDAVQINVPVHPPLTDETVATSGEVFGSVKQYVVLPAAAKNAPGALTVSVSSSLVSGIGRVLNTLGPEKYDSIDDTAHRVLIATSLATLPRSITGLTAALQSKLPVVAQRGVAKLLRTQNSDGGWPWWSGSTMGSDSTTSVDAGEALLASKAPGTQPALLRLAKYLDSAAPRTVEESAHMNLLSSRVRPTFGVVGLLRKTLAALRNRPAAIADVALLLGLKDGRTSAAALLSQLDSQAMVSATGAHWEDTGGAFATPPVLVTARVLSALEQLTPNDPLVPAAARWLMLARSGDGWDCTADSAEAVAALARYAHIAREGKSAFGYTIALDGKLQSSGQFAGARASGSGYMTIPATGLKRGAGSTLEINRTAVHGTAGSGPFYYVARLHYFLRADAILARNEGIEISRQYLDAAGKPLHSIPAGSVVQVRLLIRIGQTLQHMEVEDPVPAGLEPMDQSLNTSQQGIFTGSAVPGESDLLGYVVHSDLLDDRVSLFAESVPAGTYRYTYLAQATTPGQYAVAPSHAQEVFFPEIFGRSAGQTIGVSNG